MTVTTGHCLHCWAQLHFLAYLLFIYLIPQIQLYFLQKRATHTNRVVQGWLAACMENVKEVVFSDGGGVDGRLIDFMFLT